MNNKELLSEICSGNDLITVEKLMDHLFLHGEAYECIATMLEHFYDNDQGLDVSAIDRALDDLVRENQEQYELDQGQAIHESKQFHTKQFEG